MCGCSDDRWTDARAFQVTELALFFLDDLSLCQRQRQTKSVKAYVSHNTCKSLEHGLWIMDIFQNKKKRIHVIESSSCVGSRWKKIQKCVSSLHLHPKERAKKGNALALKQNSREWKRKLLFACDEVILSMIGRSAYR